MKSLAARQSVPERTCCLSGREGAAGDKLIRLALGARRHGRARRARQGRRAEARGSRSTARALEEAITKGKLRGALAAARSSQRSTYPTTWADQIEEGAANARRSTGWGWRRGRAVITGTEKIVDAARKGTVELLLHAV